jgi:DnaJ-class molecular chaperone
MTKCEKCGGSGWVVLLTSESACAACRGTGVATEVQIHDVTGQLEASFEAANVTPYGAANGVEASIADARSALDATVKVSPSAHARHKMLEVKSGGFYCLIDLDRVAAVCQDTAAEVGVIYLHGAAGMTFEGVAYNVFREEILPVIRGRFLESGEIAPGTKFAREGVRRH